MYERFIARQPIFDHRLRVFAYELLFRGGPQNVFQPRKDASSSVVVDSTMLFDLQTLVGHVSQLSSLTVKSGSSEDRIPECYLSAANRGVEIQL